MSTAPRKIDFDPFTGVQTNFLPSTDGKTFGIQYIQSGEAIQGILDHNHEKRAAGKEYYAQDPDMWKAASIPVGVIYEWMVKHGVDVYNPDHSDAVLKLLDDPDYRYLKTAEIILSSK